MREVSKAGDAEQVYSAALSVVQDMFAPDNGFVAVSEGSRPEAAGPLPGAGFLSDITVPIHAGEELAARLMLHYDEAREFSDLDLCLAETIGALAGFALERIQERDRLQRKQRERNELVAMAAHELRSPLTAIIGAAFLIRSGLDNERVRGLDMIERNVRIQVNLIEELLNACQLDAGKVELRIETLDLGPVLDNVVGEVQAIASGNHTSLYSSISRPLFVRGDAQRLWQVFWNILINSVRFSPGGEVRIDAGPDGASAKICVYDNGMGMRE